MEPTWFLGPVKPWVSSTIAWCRSEARRHQTGDVPRPRENRSPEAFAAQMLGDREYRRQRTWWEREAKGLWEPVWRFLSKVLHMDERARSTEGILEVFSLARGTFSVVGPRPFSIVPPPRPSIPVFLETRRYNAPNPKYSPSKFITLLANHILNVAKKNELKHPYARLLVDQERDEATVAAREIARVALGLYPFPAITRTTTWWLLEAIGFAPTRGFIFLFPPT